MELIQNYPPNPVLPLLFGFDITHFHPGISGGKPERMRCAHSSFSGYIFYIFLGKQKPKNLSHLGIVMAIPLSSSPLNHETSSWACSSHTSSQYTKDIDKEVSRSSDYYYPVSQGQQAGWLQVCERSHPQRRCYWVLRPDYLSMSVCQSEEGKEQTAGVNLRNTHSSPALWCLDWLDVSEFGSKQSG